jgi:polyhydroxyalkanoate synthesis regulator phasin
MNKKVRINLTVDEELLEKSKKKLGMFGGKLSTLFNSFLYDFVKSSKEIPGREHEEIVDKIKELEKRLKDLEEKIKR